MCHRYVFVINLLLLKLFLFLNVQLSIKLLLVRRQVLFLEKGVPRVTCLYLLLNNLYLLLNNLFCHNNVNVFQTR